MQPQGFTPQGQPFGSDVSQPSGNVSGGCTGSTGGSTGVGFGNTISNIPPPPSAAPLLDLKKPKYEATTVHPYSSISSPTTGLDYQTRISSVSSSGILQPWEAENSPHLGCSPQSKQNLLAQAQQAQAASYSQDLNYVRRLPANASPRVVMPLMIATIPPPLPPANTRPVRSAPQDRTSEDAMGAIVSTDSGAQALSEALKTNSTLTTLDLNESVIGSIEAQAVSEVLKTNSTLANLSI
ncbi:hypothetical protein BGZ81_003154 [Podila clonocystis]|nr:hypothetical protein BGZ81_003154 [Podila clonocystis]